MQHFELIFQQTVLRVYYAEQKFIFASYVRVKGKVAKLETYYLFA